MFQYELKCHDLKDFTSAIPICLSFFSFIKHRCNWRANQHPLKDIRISGWQILFFSNGAPQRWYKSKLKIHIHKTYPGKSSSLANRNFELVKLVLYGLIQPVKQRTHQRFYSILLETLRLVRQTINFDWKKLIWVSWISYPWSSISMVSYMSRMATSVSASTVGLIILTSFIASKKEGMT